MANVPDSKPGVSAREDQLDPLAGMQPMTSRAILRVAGAAQEPKTLIS
jgi:hypothetical protein